MQSCHLTPFGPGVVTLLQIRPDSLLPAPSLHLCSILVALLVCTPAVATSPSSVTSCPRPGWGHPYSGQCFLSEARSALEGDVTRLRSPIIHGLRSPTLRARGLMCRILNLFFFFSNFTGEGPSGAPKDGRRRDLHLRTEWTTKHRDSAPKRTRRGLFLHVTPFCFHGVPFWRSSAPDADET